MTSRLEIANHTITLRAGSGDYIPSVYATFDGGAMVDVTGHAYVTITAAPNAPFTVAANDPLGRLHATANATGVGSVIAQAGGFNVFTSVMIAPALTTERRIVERVRYQGDHDTHRNILFLCACGGTITTGTRKRYTDAPPMADLFIALASGLGLPLTTFGDDGTKPLAGVLR